MSFVNWLIIIAKIIVLIGEGMPKSEAVATAASIFNISEEEIWRHGGF